MTEKQLGLLIISPMVVGMGGLLWRQGALGGKTFAAIAIATTAVAAFLFLMQ